MLPSKPENGVSISRAVILGAQFSIYGTCTSAELCNTAESKLDTSKEECTQLQQALAASQHEEAKLKKQLKADAAKSRQLAEVRPGKSRLMYCQSPFLGVAPLPLCGAFLMSMLHLW